MTHDAPSVEKRINSSEDRVIATVNVTSFDDPETFTADEFGLTSIGWINVIGGDSEPGLYYDGNKGIDGGTGGASFGNLVLEVVSN